MVMKIWKILIVVKWYLNVVYTTRPFGQLVYGTRIKIHHGKLYYTSSCPSSERNSSECDRKGDPYSSIWIEMRSQNFNQGDLK